MLTGWAEVESRWGADPCGRGRRRRRPRYCGAGAGGGPGGTLGAGRTRCCTALAADDGPEPAGYTSAPRGATRLTVCVGADHMRGVADRWARLQAPLRIPPWRPTAPCRFAMPRWWLSACAAVTRVALGPRCGFRRCRRGRGARGADRGSGSAVRAGAAPQTLRQREDGRDRARVWLVAHISPPKLPRFHAAPFSCWRRSSCERWRREPAGRHAGFRLRNWRGWGGACKR